VNWACSLLLVKRKRTPFETVREHLRTGRGGPLVHGGRRAEVHGLRRARRNGEAGQRGSDCGEHVIRNARPRTSSIRAPIARRREPKCETEGRQRSVCPGADPAEPDRRAKSALLWSAATATAGRAGRTEQRRGLPGERRHGDPHRGASRRRSRSTRAAERAHARLSRASQVQLALPPLQRLLHSAGTTSSSAVHGSAPGACLWPGEPGPETSSSPPEDRRGERAV